MTSMQAARVHEKGGEYHVDSVSQPKIERPTDLIIKIRAASLCHTDFMVGRFIDGRSCLTPIGA